MNRWRRLGLNLAAPLLAIIVAVIVTSIILVLSGDPVGPVWKVFLSSPVEGAWARMINDTAAFYLSGIAVAIGFRMNLFNIGVDGQYRVAAFAAAVLAGEAWLPGWLNVIAAILLAMLVGALWAGIAAVLKTSRGVSEVISTIMLNAIATGLVAWLLTKVQADNAGSNSTGTKPIPESSHVPALPFLQTNISNIYGLSLLAVLIGFAYWFVVSRTRFGFDLRAAGQSDDAARASGIDVKRTAIIAMLLSGAVAGLVGLPALFGNDYQYGTTSQAGLGFTGIAVALIGRNHPVGVAFGAFLWAYLANQADSLQINAGVSVALVNIIQGIMVLAVVIAYELVRRLGVRMEQRQVAADLATPSEPVGAQA
ncbi:ABC transporter permease [Branchiibius sp. NY16-3462-2]|uniref:ABC transporter permease n=1 Tax=Branchiibius sp. NY16-3462-2 TaxID=1807500 RepID=UPI00079BFF0C|nr:ABC transporter permease [Branchiibius sp. NY16-3462-2]KYH43038.1 sugar ABC transporter permease [Branchiibius sp. NY16-3462-2]